MSLFLGIIVLPVRSFQNYPVRWAVGWWAQKKAPNFGAFGSLLAAAGGRGPLWGRGVEFGNQGGDRFGEDADGEGRDRLLDVSGGPCEVFELLPG
jgi:hypothetical protein